MGDADSVNPGMDTESSSGQRRLRVLHVNFGIERGGIETWLSRLIQHFDSRCYSFALAYHRGRSASMQDEFRGLGMTLHQLPAPRSAFVFVAAFRRLLREAGPFDVVHSHLNFPGLLMLAAALEGVPVRIAQSHVSPELMTPGLLPRGFVRATNRLFGSYVTTGVGVSSNAARTLFGRRWQRDPRVCIEPCGIDLAPFSVAAGAIKGVLRAELGISHDALVLGVIGRFSPEKNQAFALRVAARLAGAESGRSSGLRLLLVGEGPDRSALMALAEHLGIAGQVLFVGERDDVPALLSTVIDVMLLPSLTEGSPLTVIEAQAAGVPAVVSLAVPAASVLMEDAVRLLALTAGDDVWAQAVLDADRHGRFNDGLRQVRDSQFDLGHNIRFFDACYRQRGSPCGAATEAGDVDRLI